MNLNKIALGGGCHWCTEAVFQALKGVSQVEQGFVKAKSPYNTWSEAIIVSFRPQNISLEVLIEIHLHTHSSTVQHKMRGKYRSAIYVFSEKQYAKSSVVLYSLQNYFDQPLITKILYFEAFKPSDAAYQNYYQNAPERPFCQQYIHPKLQMLQQQYARYMS